MNTEQPTAGQTWKHFDHVVRLVARSMIGNGHPDYPQFDGPVMWEVEIIEGELVEGERTYFIAEDGLVHSGERIA